MSRTIAGYIFICKECREPHLMWDGEPHNGIYVSCPKHQNATHIYAKKDFEYYHGRLDPFIRLANEEKSSQTS